MWEKKFCVTFQIQFIYYQHIWQTFEDVWMSKKEKKRMFILGFAGAEMSYYWQKVNIC